MLTEWCLAHLILAHIINIYKEMIEHYNFKVESNMKMKNKII